MSEKNMELWNSVCTTDPAHTKEVRSKTGRLMYVSVASYQQRQRATELWGPYGHRWGLKELKYSKDENDRVLDAVFFYPLGDETVSFEQSVCMAFSPDNDTHKKLRTEAISKSLADLGFNADVFQGRFDKNTAYRENKYHDQHTQTGGPAQQRVEQSVKKTYIQILNDLIEKAMAAKSVDMLEQADQWWRKKHDEKKITDDALRAGLILLDTKRGELVEDAFNAEQVGLNLQA